MSSATDADVAALTGVRRDEDLMVPLFVEQRRAPHLRRGADVL
jgi:hypothetical protein